MSFTTRTRRSNEPHLVGDGSPLFSTSTSIVKFPLIIWDVNGYYRELGIPTNASRKEIKDAYVSLDGSHNERLTFIVKQLLNSDIRAAYDATPLGNVFMDDHIKRALKRRLFDTKTSLDLLDIATSNDLDGTAQEGQDEFLSHPLNRVCEWSWPHYLWGLTDSNRERLRHWQHALINASNGEQYQIAIGLMSGTQVQWAVRTIGYHTVIFFDLGVAPNPITAEKVFERVRKSHGIS